MRRHNRLFVTLVAATLAAAVLAPGSARAVEDSDRADKWDFAIAMRYFSSELLTGKGGSTVDINSDIAWGFSFDYNVTENFNAGFDFTWMDANYDATIESGDLIPPPGFPIGVAGTLEASTGAFTGQYNFLPKTITPFVSGGLGWTWIDSNIPTGPTQGVCWWDPWWGYVCDTWRPTASESYFSYGVGAGVRADLTEAVYIEGAYNFTWIDFDKADTTDFSGFRLDFGWSF
jgi:opacity protein-like surface antigen